MKISKVYKAKTFEEAKKKCPKGYRLPEIWELVKLACEGEKKIFKTDKGKFIFFWSSSLYRKHSVRRLYRDWGGSWGAYWGAYWGGLDDSYAYGRVVYVKENLKDD